MRAAVKEMLRYGTDILGADIIIRVTAVNKASTKLVESMEGWERMPDRDGEIAWPANKGGGDMRAVKIWRWVPTSS